MEKHETEKTIDTKALVQSIEDPLFRYGSREMRSALYQHLTDRLAALEAELSNMRTDRDGAAEACIQLHKDSEESIMIPERIYLQADADTVISNGGATWCQDQVNDDDVEYVRADLLEAAQAEARELRQSRREAIDMANDNAVLAADALRERDELRKESERLEAENQQLLSTFRHSHHRSDNGDSCAQCGLDLRHPIHNRTLASGGDK